jgi:A/G-specific adenine glycosylase
MMGTPPFARRAPRRLTALSRAPTLRRVLVPSARRAALRRRLLAWYGVARRALPWRFAQHGADPYRVWIAEVMLQQTQVATVIPYYERFVARYPTLRALATADDDDVLALWSGLGYYARCRNLLAAARAAHGHGGLPGRSRCARSPGSALTRRARSRASPSRCPRRRWTGTWRASSRGSSASRAIRRAGGAAPLWELARELVPADRPGDFNQALMELGATVCTEGRAGVRAVPGAGRAARRAGEDASRAPACAAARAAARGHDRVRRGGGEGRARARPSRAGRSPRRPVGPCRRWTSPGRRAPGDGGAWRTLRARFGAGVTVGERLGETTRTLTHRSLTLRAYACDIPGARAAGEDVRRVPPRALAGMGISAATRALLAAAGWPRRPSA